eukprot:scaffold4562_cov132-Skeletonema_menzelii.AAC.1
MARFSTQQRVVLTEAVVAGLLPPHPMVIYFNCNNVIVAKCVDEDATWKICRLAICTKNVEMVGTTLWSVGGLRSWGLMLRRLFGGRGKRGAESH